MDQQATKDIGQLQRTDAFQRGLRASSYLYSKAKLISGIQVFLTILVPVVLSALSVLFSRESQQGAGLKGWAAFYGIAVVLLDSMFLDKTQKSLKKEAAQIQELFDCELLEMPWNEFKAGDKPTPEKIDQSSRALGRELTEREINWYPGVVGRLPLYLCRLVCQRTNIWWDGELRRRYAFWLSTFAVGMMLLAAIVGMVKNMSLVTFVLTIMAPLFPAAMWFIRERNRQKESTATLDRLMKHTTNLWTNVLDAKMSPSDALDKSRELQDELFVHRQSNQPIPNVVNRIFAGRFDQSMNKGAEELVEAAQAAIRGQTKR
jgi:hypothetical protein